MEALGAAASILALIEATAVMERFFRGLKSARKEIKQLERELAILYSLLLLLRNLRCYGDLLGRSVPDAKSTISAIPILELENGPLAEYSAALVKLQAKIDASQGPGFAIIWVLVKGDAKEMLEKLERLKSAISVILNVDQLKLTMATLEKTTQAGYQLEEKEEMTRRTEALSWISSASFVSRQADFKSRLEKNTCNWFLDAPQFRDWVQQPKKILFCPGIPGAGKTMMASHVIDHIETNCIKSSQNNNLAWIFCDYKAERSHTVPELLGSLLQQLVQNNPSLSDHLLNLYENHMEKKTAPSSEEIFACLKNVVAEHTDVYIIVDALDELPQAYGKRRQLLDHLFRISSETDVIHIMVTTRPIPDIVHRFKGMPTIEVEARPDDVKRFVRGRFDDFRARVSDEWRARIEEAIVSRSNGMFLIARFLVERFARLHTMRQVKELINQISDKSPSEKQPTSIYDQAYDETMKRISSQAAEDRALAGKVIMWITNAARLLTTKELCCALSVEPGDTEFDPDNWYPVGLILDVCAGLVIAEKETDIIRFVHYTAQEYFDRKKGEHSKTDNQQIATVCLTYLCFDQFKPQKPEPDSDTNELSGSDVSAPFRMDPAHQVMRRGSWVRYGSQGAAWESTILSGPSSRVQSIQIADSSSSHQNPSSYCFKDYAANYWAFHACDCQQAVSKQALRLLSNQGLSAHAFLHATSLHEPWPNLRLHASSITQMTGLHLVAGFGLTDLLRNLLFLVDKSPNLHADAKDDDRRTPLMWAAHHGHIETVKLLLARSDVRPDRMCSRRNMALHYAARRGWLVIVKMLLENTNVRSRCDMEHEFGETALVQAALEGHREVVEVLQKYDVTSIHREVMFGQWPIHLAAQRRPVSVIRLLLDEYGVDPLIEDPKGYTPFTVAVDWNNYEVVRYFLKDKRELLDGRPEQVVKAVHIAAANRKRLGVMRLIVEEIEWTLTARDEQERTLLETALDAGNIEAVIYLSQVMGYQ